MEFEIDSKSSIDYFQKLSDMFWICLTCKQTLLLASQVECPTCTTFRPLETYQNMLHSPDQSTQTEIAALNTRRSIERQMMAKAQVDTSQPWYALSNTWYYRWQCFLHNKIAKAPSVTI